MTTVNNVTRYLDSRGIKYTQYELPVEKLGALEVARQLDVDPATVYKTIVLTREKSTRKKPLLVLIPGFRQVDLKAVAAFLGEKKVFLPTEREAEKLTGLQAGGISPLALINKGFDVLIDSSAQGIADMYISGGQRGLIVCLPVVNVVQSTNAHFAVVSRSNPV